MVLNRPDALNKSQTLKEASTSSFHISKNDEESMTKRPRHMIVIATMKSMGTNKKNKNKQTKQTPTLTTEKLVIYGTTSCVELRNLFVL